MYRLCIQVIESEQLLSHRMASSYAKHMAQLSARIFGEVVRPTDRKSMRVVRLYARQPHDKTPDIVEYYPRHVELTSLMKRLRYLGLFRSVVQLHV